jgi:hypothetical protein
MPFAGEFDDVYATIKTSVETASQEHQVRCFRLDESRPAGRITDRLLQELQSASLCIADLTGEKPNVMWEVGYAMALGKPTIIITQEQRELPFDVRVMETIRYDRSHLNSTLGRPLKRATVDTIQTMSPSVSDGSSENNLSPAFQTKLIGELREQVHELRSIVTQAVRAWSPTPEQERAPLVGRSEMRALEGAWVDHDSRSNFYARVIDDDLVIPYCIAGNDRLTGVLYGCKKVGEFWFARFCRLSDSITGFVFLKRESLDVLTGAWWMNVESVEIPEAPDLGTGVSIRLEHVNQLQYPEWASQFFDEVRHQGIVNSLTARRSGSRPEHRCG